MNRLIGVRMKSIEDCVIFHTSDYTARSPDPAMLPFPDMLNYRYGYDHASIRRLDRGCHRF